MVAPSFKDYKIESEKPYLVGNKYYIDVRNPKNDRIRMVRWYTEKEYARLYSKKEKKEQVWNMKHARGFDKGPILVIRGNTPADEDWLKLSIARYAVGIGWHFISTDILPDNRPPHFKYILLGWNEFKEDDTHPKDAAILADIIAEKYKEGKFIDI